MRQSTDPEVEFHTMIFYFIYVCGHILVFIEDREGIRSPEAGVHAVVNHLAGALGAEQE